MENIFLNTFHATVLFLYLLKAPEVQSISEAAIGSVL